MLKFTARQLEILELIRNAIEQTGFPPTRAEISAELGFRSANAAEEHLQALARKGAIEISPGTSRGIRLLPLASSILREQPTHGDSRVISMAERAGRRTAIRKTESGKSAAAATASVTSLINSSSGRPSAKAVSNEPKHSNVHGIDTHVGGRRLTIPLLGQVAAGAPILATEHIDTTYSFDPGFFASEPDFLLRVKGASMRDAGILDGDLLAVRKTSTAVNGQIVVARLGDDVTVKRFQRSGHTIELLPENPEFKPIVISSEEDQFSLEGLVVGLVRRWQ